MKRMILATALLALAACAQQPAAPAPTNVTNGTTPDPDRCNDRTPHAEDCP